MYTALFKLESGLHRAQSWLSHIRPSMGEVNLEAQLYSIYG
jgi:hypothetical protein